MKRENLFLRLASHSIRDIFGVKDDISSVGRYDITP